MPLKSHLILPFPPLPSFFFAEGAVSPHVSVGQHLLANILLAAARSLEGGPPANSYRLSMQYIYLFFLNGQASAGRQKSRAGL